MLAYKLVCYIFMGGNNLDLWPHGPGLLCRGRQHPEKGSFLLREIEIEKVMEIKIEINKPPCWGTQHQ